MIQGNFKGVALCLFAAILWGGMFPVMSTTLFIVDIFTFTSIRYLIAGILFVVIAIVIEGRNGIALRGERIGLAWLIGSIGFAGFNFLIFFGQQIAGRDGALIASVLIATQPILGVLVNWFINKKTPSLYSFLFIVISFVGVVLVITKGDISAVVKNPRSYAADGLMLLASLCWVVYTSSVAFFPTWSPYKYTATTCMLGLSSVFTINAILVVSGMLPVPSATAFETIVPQILYMALPAGVIAVLCWVAGNKTLAPVNGVLFMNAVPVTTFGISAIQGIIPNPVQILGAAFTCFALILNNIYIRRRNHR
jgi:drug/metabolite transporter (DMT)-like permease